MANPTKNNETTGGSFSSFDLSKIEGVTGQFIPYGGFGTTTPVLCKDGTKKMQPNSQNAKYMDVCRDNGGVVSNETVKYAVIKQDAEDKFYEKLGIETQGNRVMSGGGISSKSKGRLLIAVVLVAGYFAYKKFKK